MTESSFDPGGFFQFDLAHGAVRSRGGSRVLLVTEDVLAPLIRTAVGQGDLTAVRSLGSQLGNLVSSALGKSASSSSPGEMIVAAGSVMSLFGWGRLRLEQWGDALVLQVDSLPPLDGDNLAVAALLGGLFSTVCGSEVACVPLARSSKYIMVDPSVAEQIWTWSKGGESLAAIASKLAVAS